MLASPYHCQVAPVLAAVHGELGSGRVRGGPGLVVVADPVHARLALAGGDQGDARTGPVAVVVEDVVADVGDREAGDLGVAVHVRDEQVAVQADVVRVDPAQQGALGVLALRVGRVRQSFGDDRVADGDVLTRVVGVEHLVDGPGHRHVVDHHVLGARLVDGQGVLTVVGAGRRTGSQPQVAQHDVVGRDQHRSPVDAGRGGRVDAQRDPAAGRGLSRDREVGVCPRRSGS